MSLVCYHLSSRMNYPLYLCPVLILAYLGSMLAQDVCDFTDVACLTKGGKNVYSSIITGIKGVVEPIDPLSIEKIDGETLGVNYELSSVKLTGMKYCDLKQLLLNEKDSGFQVDLHCPKLLLDYGYKASGIFASSIVDGSGTAMMTIDDYLITFKGKYELIISAEDQKPHFSITSYNINTDLKGKVGVTYEILTRNANDQTDQAAAYVNENYELLKPFLQSPIMEKFMALVVDRVKAFFKIHPVDQVIPL